MFFLFSAHFWVGGKLSQTTLAGYFQKLTWALLLVFLGVSLQFEDAPPSPPSDTAWAIQGTDILMACIGVNLETLSTVKSTASAVMMQLSDFDNLKEEEEKVCAFYQVVGACLTQPGFCHALAAFSTSSVVVNVLSTYMKDLAPNNLAGVVALFQFVIMVSSVLFVRVTDQI